MRRERKSRLWLVLLTVLLVLSVLAVAALTVVWRLNEYTLALSLQGDAEITMEYGTVFEDPGASAQFSGTLLLRDVRQVPVTVEGEVDTAKVGTYELRYVAQITYHDLFWERTQTKEVSRRIHVVDTQAPEITLTYTEGHYTLPGHEYVEEGYSASDGYDGDLTNRVVCTVGDGIVTYLVTDSSGNAAQAVRTIFYDDPIPPELTLVGDAAMTLTEGDSFTDPGCTATDNCDGDLTSSITVTGTVDTQKPGTYTLTYTVADGYENTVSVTRTVTVKEKPVTPPVAGPEPEPEPEPYIPDEPLPPNGKVIYLTFDDGPGKNTSRLLDILDKYNVKATFFVIGTGYLDEVLPRMAAAGHTIAMHTYSHTYSKVYASDEAFLEDLQRIQDKIFEYTGQTATILRFPGGSSNTASRHYSPGIMTRLTKTVEDMGYRYFDWNVDSKDAGGASTADQVYRNVVRGVSKRNYSIVLQHDIKGFSVDAVEKIIQWGLANGYTFAALDMDSPSCEHALNN